MFKAIAPVSFPPVNLHLRTTRLFPGETTFSNGKRSSNAVFALKGDYANYDRKGYNNGKLVDDSMIVLRMRIRETEMEMGEKKVPENWMEWEKMYYGSNDYGSDVCEGVGVLQRWLMETRPSFALALVALVMFSFPFSLGVLVWHLMNVLH